MELTATANWLNTSFASIDEGAAIAVHKLYELAPWFFTPFMNLVSLLGKGGIFLIAFSFCLILYPKTRKLGTCMILGLGLGALMTNAVFKPIAHRPRPYTWDGSVYQEYWILLGRHTHSDYCFPSGHTTAAFAFAVSAILYDKKKYWPLIFFGVFMAVSRIYLSVHYFTDVLAGAVVGSVGGLGGYWLTQYIPNKYYRIDMLGYIPFLKNLGGNGKHLKK